MTGGFFPGSAGGRFPEKRTGPSGARKVFFRKRGFRKNDFNWFAPAAQTPAEGFFFSFGRKRIKRNCFAALGPQVRDQCRGVGEVPLTPSALRRE